MAADRDDLENEEFDGMRAEIFDIAAASLSFHGAHVQTPRIVQAARAVLVDGMRPADAADKFDFPRERISEACGRIRDKWDSISEENGWVTETFSLSPRLVELIREIETDAIAPLLEETLLRRKKKMEQAQAKLTALKVAEKKSTYRNKTKTKTKSKR